VATEAGRTRWPSAWPAWCATGRRRWRTGAGAWTAWPPKSWGDGLTLHLARTYNERRRGLAGLDELPADHALHILKCFGVHTFGMRFDLDLIWLDKAEAWSASIAGSGAGASRLVRARAIGGGGPCGAC